MPKDIQCGQCKYLKPTENAFRSGGPRFLRDVPDYYCEADKSIYLDREDVSGTRNCPFYRSASETVWQEVRKDILKKIPDLLGKIFSGK